MIQFFRSVQYFLDCIFFAQPTKKSLRSVRTTFIALLYIIGATYWVYFFKTDNLATVTYDWAKENVYISTLRQALVGKMIPWQWSDLALHGTDKILAIPEIVFTPDIILLAWVSNEVFIAVHTIIFYSAGFLGMLLLTRKAGNSLVAIIVFWLVFNFNGYITSHLAVGHFQWTGYFLLPVIYYLLLNMITDSQASPSNHINSLFIALTLGLLFLNGSFHIAIWCIMLMGLLLLVKRQLIWKQVTIAFATGSLLGFVRLFPAALFTSQRTASIPGYENLGTLLDAFTSLRSYENHLWWEYDIFIGFVAFIVLSICFYIALKHNAMVNKHSLLLAAFVLFVISLGNVYALISQSPIPFANIERVPSRFIIMPFITCLIVSTAGIDKLVNYYPKESKPILLMAIPFIVHELVSHSIVWQVNNLGQMLEESDLPSYAIVSNPDPLYVASVGIGCIITIVSFTAVMVLMFYHRIFSITRGRQNANETLSSR